MKYIDIHSHLSKESYGEDLPAVIKRMQENEVGTITIGTTLADSIEAVKIAEANENVWACIGVHPRAEAVPVFDIAEFEKLIVHPKVVAIGECGLDYYKPETDLAEMKKVQREVFIKQIELAIKYDKPLMLHLRDGEERRQSHQDTLDILEKYRGRVRGNVHFLSASLDWAKKFIDLGFTISFVGLITYIQDFNKIIKNVPIECLHAETDSPYVAPVPHRGERNEPSYVIPVYQKIAEIRGIEPEVARQALLSNASRMFKIKL